jgi:hypothetical protein
VVNQQGAKKRNFRCIANERAAHMSSVLDSPIGVFTIALVTQWIAALAGDHVRRRRRLVRKEEREDIDTIQAAALTLLALIIGFSFAMAVTRYDLRKTYEEAEANAIGTEYVRADTLPANDAAAVHELLKKYLDQRILFYQTRDQRRIDPIGTDTARLQAALWSAILPAANTQPTPITALAVSGMNDVLNSQARTQGAWWNRIPVAAWGLMGLIAIACNVMLGYSEHRRRAVLLLVLPVIVSISLLLIADIDSPRGGLIRVVPENLISLAQSLEAR